MTDESKAIPAGNLPLFYMRAFLEGLLPRMVMKILCVVYVQSCQGHKYMSGEHLEVTGGGPQQREAETQANRVSHQSAQNTAKNGVPGLLAALKAAGCSPGEAGL